jgi:hypothetical protein
VRGGHRRSGRAGAEVLPRLAYRRVVRAEHGGPGAGDAGVVAAGLVPVAELLGDRGEVEGEGQHQRVGGVPAPLAGGEGLLQYASRGGGLVGLAVQAGQQVGGAQHLRVVLAVAGPERIERVGQQSTRPGEVAGGALGQRPVLEGDQGRGL